MLLMLVCPQAFEAPLLQECHSNSTGNEIVRTVGATKVLYGTTGIVANATVQGSLHSRKPR